MRYTDSIYLNANVITVDAHNRRAEVLAVRDEHGEPTGLFTDRAKALIERAMPPH